jgi:hypothetical protein
MARTPDQVSRIATGTASGPHHRGDASRRIFCLGRSKGLGDNAADHEARADDHRAVRIVHLRDLGISRVGMKPAFNRTEHPTADVTCA